MRRALPVVLLLAGCASTRPSTPASPPAQPTRPAQAQAQARPAPPAAPPLAAGRWVEHRIVGRCGGSAEGSALVQVYLPAGYTPARRWPLVLALHGWKHEAGRWRDLGLDALADAQGLVVVAPELDTSVYERAFYPETARRWGPSPGACWAGEVVLPWARRTLAVDRTRGRTAVIGYSTGGRGALVLAARYPEFAFAGSLSGTYDLAALEERTGEYLIHQQVFGPRGELAARWRDEEIPLDAPALAATRLWLAHGADDPVVPASQQDGAAAALAPGHPELVARRVPGAGHGDELWRAELPPLAEALARALGARPGGLGP
jgi:S-formylglutathione hydrolase FrmB